MSRSAFIKFIASGLLPLCLVAGLLAGGFYFITIQRDSQVTSTIPTPSMPSLKNEKAVEYLKQSGIDKSLHEAVSAARHNVQRDQGKLVASNHANNLKAEFNSAGLQLGSVSK